MVAAVGITTGEALVRQLLTQGVKGDIKRLRQHSRSQKYLAISGATTSKG